MLRFWKQHFVAFFIQQQNLFFPDLVNFTIYDFANAVFVFFDKNIFLQVVDAACQRLFSCKDRSSSKFFLNINFLIQFFTYLVIRFNFYRVFIFHFCKRVVKIIVVNDGSSAENFQIAFLIVYNNVKVFIRTIFFPDKRFKHVFHDLHQSRPVNVFSVFKLLE